MIPTDPLFTIEVTDESIGLEGYVCIHSIGRAGSSGGMRCVPDISKEEVKLLARAMSFKYSYFGIPQGGAKAGIRMPYGAPIEERRRLISAMAKHLEPLIKRSNIWSVWTDMNFYGADLQHFFGSIGIDQRYRKTSGSTIRTGITGAWSVEATAKALGLSPQDTRIAIEGYGGVAQVATNILTRQGFRIAALSNHLGAVHNTNGLDIDEVQRAKAAHGHRWVETDGNWQRIGYRELFQVPSDILMPGARVHSIDIETASKLNTRALVPVANVPCTDAAIKTIETRGIVYLPDYVVNGGGVCGWIKSEKDPFGKDFQEMIVRALGMQETTGRPVRELCEEIAHTGFVSSTAEAYVVPSLKGKLLNRMLRLPGIRTFASKRDSGDVVRKMSNRLNAMHRH